jgi:hypothetical protein
MVFKKRNGTVEAAPAAVAPKCPSLPRSLMGQEAPCRLGKRSHVASCENTACQGDGLHCCCESHVSARKKLPCSPPRHFVRHISQIVNLRDCTMSGLGCGKGAIGRRVNKPGGWKPRGLVHARPHTLVRLWPGMSNVLISAAKSAPQMTRDTDSLRLYGEVFDSSSMLGV